MADGIPPGATAGGAAGNIPGDGSGSANNNNNNNLWYNQELMANMQDYISMPMNNLAANGMSSWYPSDDPAIIPDIAHDLQLEELWGSMPNLPTALNPPPPEPAATTAANVTHIPESSNSKLPNSDFRYVNSAHAQRLYKDAELAKLPRYSSGAAIHQTFEQKGYASPQYHQAVGPTSFGSLARRKRPQQNSKRPSSHSLRQLEMGERYEGFATVSAKPDKSKKIKRHAQLPKDAVLSLHLESEDELQCRFAVKNDSKAANQRLEFVQANGYVEYKARYSKKRGGHQGYGQFVVSFVSPETSIFPFINTETSKDVPVASSAILLQEHLHNVELLRVEITIRLFQSYRGAFPVHLVKFSEEEMYHSLYVTEWQETSLLHSDTSEGIVVESDPDGAFIRYVFQGNSHLNSINENGLRFPCPVPTHPEKLNDIGMLRMQVNVKMFPTNSRNVPWLGGYKELNSWIKIKVVQQLSTKKLMFGNMLRSSTTGGEWSLPPQPEITEIPMSKEQVVLHVLGEETLQSQTAVDFLLCISKEIARRADMTRFNVLSDEAPENALLCASRDGNLAVVRLLLRGCPALIHRTNKDGDSALHIAVHAKSMDVVHLLYEYGAKLHVSNQHRQTPIDLAKQLKDQAIYEFLREGDAEGCTSLQRACTIGHLKCVRRILKEYRSDDDKRRNINRKNCEGFTPLILATLHKQAFVVQTLLLSGADPLLADAEGETALHHAARCGFVDAVVMLSHSHEQAPCALASDRGTPLHRAAQSGEVLACIVLISCGTDPSATNDKQQTARDIATSLNHPGCKVVISYHQDHQQMSSTTFNHSRMGGTLWQAALSGDIALTRQLLQNGNKANEKNAVGDTPIKLAAQANNLLVLDELLGWHKGHYPKEPVCVGRNDITPLHAACYRGSIGCVLVLLASELVDINARTEDEQDTALHVCARNGLPVCCSFLMLAGADVTLRNSEDKTAQDLAIELKHSATTQMLQANADQLVALSTVLKTTSLDALRKANPIGSDKILRSDLFFSWQGFDELLATIWHATHSVRNILSAASSASR